MSFPSRCLPAARVGKHSSWMMGEVGRQVSHKVSQLPWSCFLGCLLPLIGFGRHVSPGIGRSPMRSNAPRQILHKWRKQRRHGFWPLPRIASFPDHVKTTSLRSHAGQACGGICLLWPQRSRLSMSARWGEITRSYGDLEIKSQRCSQAGDVGREGAGGRERDNGRRQKMVAGRGRREDNLELGTARHGNLQSPHCRGHPLGLQQRHVRLSLSDRPES
jgi:hypothetical protein